jgi:hypothetical protein
MKQQKTLVLGMIMLIFIAIIAVGGYFYYKKQDNKKDGPTNVTINTDGTVTLDDSATEHFLYSVNGVEGSGVSNDQPYHFRYYKNKATRGSVWKGMRDLPSEAPDCQNPDCVHFDVTNQAMTEEMINDVIPAMESDLRDFRKYLKSKDMETVDKFKAKWNQSPIESFVFEHMIKGYAVYKGIAGAEAVTSKNDPVLKEIPLLDSGIVNFLFLIMIGRVRLQRKNTKGKYELQFVRNTGEGVHLKFGRDFPLFLGILFMSIILIVTKGKSLGKVTYKTPATVLSMQALQTNLNSKMGNIFQDLIP